MEDAPELLTREQKLKLLQGLADSRGEETIPLEEAKEFYFVTSS